MERCGADIQIATGICEVHIKQWASFLSLDVDIVSGLKSIVIRSHVTRINTPFFLINALSLGVPNFKYSRTRI